MLDTFKRVALGRAFAVLAILFGFQFLAMSLTFKTNLIEQFYITFC
jgi:hypothetical protein